MIIQSRASLKAILPHDWLISRLGLHGKFMSGSAFPDQFQGRCNEEIPFYKVADLARSSDGVHMPEPMHTISDETRKRLKAKLIPKGSIVYAKIGAASLLNRRRVTTRSCCIDNNMTAFVPEQVSPEWALIWLRSLDFGAYMCPATVPSISEGIQADLPLGLPPMEYEQRSIALLNERLPKIDKLITLLEDKSSALSSYRQSLITRAVTKGLDGDHQTSFIPLKYLAKLNPDVEQAMSDEIEYLPMEKVKNGMFLHHSDKLANLPPSLNSFEDGDILLAKVTPCFENGNICLAENCKGGVGRCSTELFVLRPNPQKVMPKFLMLLLQTQSFKQEAACQMRGTGGLKRIPADWLCNYKFPIPSLEKQKQIVEYMASKHSNLDGLTKIIKDSICLLNDYRSSLISAAVTGQLAIEEAEE